jgi:protein CpxP
MKSKQDSFAKRALMVALIAGSGFLATTSYAMPEGGPGSKAGCGMTQGQQAHGKAEAHRAKHLSALKEKLKLAPRQEAAWNAFASTSQPGKHVMRGDRQAKRGEFAKLNTPQRLDKMLAMSDMRRAKLAERAQATKAFYVQLSPAQQSVFDAETMRKRHHGGHHRHGHHQRGQA